MVPRHSKRYGFNPTAQHADVSNAHVFISRAPSDLRGSCPAMKHWPKLLEMKTLTTRNPQRLPTVRTYPLNTLCFFSNRALTMYRSKPGPCLSSRHLVEDKRKMATIFCRCSTSEEPSYCRRLLRQSRRISNTHNSFEGDARRGAGQLWRTIISSASRVWLCLILPWTEYSSISTHGPITVLSSMHPFMPCSLIIRIKDLG